ncbi:glycosyl transferase group 1 [Desulfovibrio sp. X2]|uniref:glycosyltransferase family 4 protein n=1 Tax=Desulfovibrio sp. X2 TaxID=941449 RepID=UPI000358F041|nr:glycosyltransferase family 4 protein [Desulfovibrio sp. X2]EPR41213.1 glycosyl transferase group 1 [Desulfovibrio sp. X2]
MRAIQVVNVRFFNATAWYAFFLARLMREAGHEALVVGLPGTESFGVAERWGLAPVPMELNTQNPLRMAALYRDIAALVSDFRPDVVDCHRGESFLLWAILKLRTRAFRLVRTRGDQRLPKANLPNTWLHRDAADAVIATNSRMARHFVREMGLPRSKVWTILGGVDTDCFRFDAAGRERVRAEFGFTPDDQVVGIVGRFDEVKGQRELIAAMGRLRQRDGMHRARLFLVGFPTTLSTEQVMAWCREAGIEDGVRVTGPRDDVAACLSALDVGVCASLFSETIARAPMEIMACGRPLISTSVGVLPDLIPPQALCRPGDVPGMEELLLLALSQPEWLAAVREEEQRTMSQYSGRDFLSQTLSLYQGLITGSGGNG